jgi:hypothetical protein
LAETGQGAGWQFLGKCYLKSFQIVVPKFYNQIHDFLKAGEDPMGLLEKISGFNVNDFKEHSSMPGPMGQLWVSLSRAKEWRMSLEEVLKDYRGYVSDPLLVKLYLQLKLDHGHLRTPHPMTMQATVQCSQMKSYQPLFQHIETSQRVRQEL